jgi:cell wall-associated NlpC family hydrolase
MIEVAKYIGKQFAWGGRGPDFFDCYGLVQAIHRDLGIELPDYASTDDKSLIHGLINDAQERFQPLAQAISGAIVTFSVHPRYVSHLGMVLDDVNRFIHIAENIHVTVERLSSPLFRGRIKGFYRWKG